MCIPRKLRNLKDAATKIAQFRFKLVRITPSVHLLAATPDTHD